MRVASRVAERLKTYLSGISQNVIELKPNAQSSSKTENFVNTSKKSSEKQKLNFFNFTKKD